MKHCHSSGVTILCLTKPWSSVRCTILKRVSFTSMRRANCKYQSTQYSTCLQIMLQNRFCCLHSNFISGTPTSWQCPKLDNDTCKYAELENYVRIMTGTCPSWSLNPLLAPIPHWLSAAVSATYATLHCLDWFSWHGSRWPVWWYAFVMVNCGGSDVATQKGEPFTMNLEL